MTEALGAQILAELQALRREVAALSAGLAEGRGPRDAADEELLAAIHVAVKGRLFTVRELWRHAAVDTALRRALTAADLTTPQEVGCLFRRLEGRPIARLILTRADDSRDGVVWRLCDFNGAIVASPQS